MLVYRPTVLANSGFLASCSFPGFGSYKADLLKEKFCAGIDWGFLNTGDGLLLSPWCWMGTLSAISEYLRCPDKDPLTSLLKSHAEVCLMGTRASHRWVESVVPVQALQH